MTLTDEAMQMLAAMTIHAAAAGPVRCVVLPSLADELLRRLSSTVRRRVSIRPPSNDPIAGWLAASAGLTAAWVVAPETAGILPAAVLTLRRGGVRVIAPDAWSLRTFCDKSATAAMLRRLNHPAPPTWIQSNRPSPGLPTSASGWVVKPAASCGCDSVRWLADWTSARADARPGELIQPWIDGTAASIVMLGNRRSRQLLPPVEQRIVRHPGDAIQVVEYLGPGPPLDAARAGLVRSHVTDLIDRWPVRLTGVLGFDVVITPEGQVVTIEVNPRVTTSFGVARLLDKADHKPDLADSAFA